MVIIKRELQLWQIINQAIKNWVWAYFRFYLIFYFLSYYTYVSSYVFRFIYEIILNAFFLARPCSWLIISQVALTVFNEVVMQWEYIIILALSIGLFKQSHTFTLSSLSPPCSCFSIFSRLFILSVNRCLLNFPEADTILLFTYVLMTPVSTDINLL